MKSFHSACLTVLILVFVTLNAGAQNPATSSRTPAGSSDSCRIPGTLKSSAEPNMFSEEQEQWLGQIMDQSLRRDFNVIEDPDGYLQKLGDRLVAQLPSTHIQYHFSIIDSPELNSFGVAGGYIYIHRRMIAFCQNEDELAALLGHEIGHIADHHAAIRITNWLKQLGVTSVGDKQDVYQKWNLFEDNNAKIKERHAQRQEQEEQLIADRLAVYAATRAGYDPMHYVEFADRLLETKGNKGNFWSDFFGATTSSSKRLRELVKTAEPVAKACVTPVVADASHFTQWQKSIIESRRVAAKQDIPGLVRKVALQPQLRGDVDNLQFSPDGKYLLAQDDSSIFVLTREPLASLFRIDALDAHTAHFSGDSQAVIFYDKELRVEKWDIASKARTGMHQVTIPECFQSALSPSGKYLGCVDQSLNLRVVDVENNKIMLLKKDFYRLSYKEYNRYIYALYGIEPFRLFDLKFSPDGRYLAVGHRDTAFVYDFNTESELKIPIKMQNLMAGSFAFISPDEIAGLEFNGNSAKLIRARFPSGDKIGDFKFGADGWLSSTQSSNFLLVRPAGAYPVGLVDLSAQKIALAFKSPAFAVYGKTFAGEQNSGEIALLNSEDNKLVAKVQLPDSPLSRPKAAKFSANGKWLAVSGESRGSLWKLDSGDRVFFMRGFEGALFEDDQIISQFTKHEPDPARVFQFDPATKGAKKLYDIEESPRKDHSTFQRGDVLITVRPEKDETEIYTNLTFDDLLHELNRHSVLEVRDVRTNKLLWEKTIQERHPKLFYDGPVITVLRSPWGGVRAAAKDDPALKSKLGSGDDKRDEYVIQTFETSTGKVLGSLVIETTKFSFNVDSAHAAGDLMFIGDSAKRTQVYSMKTGEQKGKLIGHVITASQTGDRVLIENEDGIADLYDTATLQPVTHFSFPSRICVASFAADGSLMVLTADQSVYQVNPKANTQSASVK